MRQDQTMASFYDVPPGRLGEALDAALSAFVRRPPAHERFFNYPGLIEVDWEAAADCHHSNITLVGTIGAMIDPVAAAGALEKVKLASIVGGVSRLDDSQSGILAAAAGKAGAELLMKSFFGKAVQGLIEAEGLDPYFEFTAVDDDAGEDHYGILPAGYAESTADEAAAYAKGDDPEPRDLFVEMRQRANDRRLDTHGRVALVAVMSLYNELDTRECFKGRGWAFSAREFGHYLRDRAERRPAAFTNLLLAMATYHGW